MCILMTTHYYKFQNTSRQGIKMQRNKIYRVWQCERRQHTARTTVALAVEMATENSQKLSVDLAGGHCRAHASKAKQRQHAKRHKHQNRKFKAIRQNKIEHFYKVDTR